jgi:pimeloyl-ACP methyl ester carboxylesterase
MKLLPWIGLVIVLGALWLWTPDKSREELEAQYATAPSRFVDVAGLRLHVRVSGPESAPAIVMLHGLGSSLHTWEAWAAGLPEYRVIRLDLPGFGLTGPDPTNDYSDARSVAVIAALLDRLAVPRATVLGHSMGGRIAWQFAAAHPERVERLVLVSPDGFASPGFEYGKAPEVPAVAALMRHVLPRFVLRMNLEPGFADRGLVTDALLTRYHDLLRAPGVRGAVLERTRQTVLSDPAPTLQRIHAPVLLLWGEQDAMIPVANAADYQRLLPDSRLALLPGVGHLPQEEAPERGLGHVREFLGLAPAARPNLPLE